MPRGDKTGPMGNGSRTGRALGDCAGNNQAIKENDNSTYGRRNGFRRSQKRMGNGRGMGFRSNIQNPMQDSIPNIKEKTIVINQINILRDQLESLEERLKTFKD